MPVSLQTSSWESVQHSYTRKDRKLPTLQLLHSTMSLKQISRFTRMKLEQSVLRIYCERMSKRRQIHFTASVSRCTLSWWSLLVSGFKMEKQGLLKINTRGHRREQNFIRVLLFMVSLDWTKTETLQKGEWHIWQEIKADVEKVLLFLVWWFVCDETTMCRFPSSQPRSASLFFQDVPLRFCTAELVFK